MVAAGCRRPEADGDVGVHHVKMQSMHYPKLSTSKPYPKLPYPEALNPKPT